MAETTQKSARLTRAEQAALRDFVIVIDTRENLPYRFKGQSVVFDALKAGDYSVKGMTDIVAIERKTFGDFVGSVSFKHEHFMSQVKAMAKMKVKAVVVETDFSQIARGAYPYSRVNPWSAVMSLVEIVTDYGVPVLTLANRKQAEQFVLEMLRRAFLRERGLK